MSKRGLSLDEKKSKMIEIFHETNDFFQLKDLEKMAPKMKGIVQQSVKEVLDDLRNDNLIQFDKIGTSNYYWCFPSADGAAKQALIDRHQSEISVLEVKIDELEKELAGARIGREDCTTRANLLTALAEKTLLSQQLKSELEAFGLADPIKAREKAKGVEIAKEACLRWTDNTMILVSFVKSAGYEESIMRAALDIGPEWENLIIP